MSVTWPLPQVDYAANLQPGAEPPIFEATGIGWMSFRDRIGAWFMVKTQLCRSDFMVI